MKNTALLCLFLLSLSLSAQTDKLILYVDASDSGQSLIKIQEQVDSVIRSKSNTDFYLFISMGNSPLFAEKIEDVSKTLRKLRFMEFPSPDFVGDINKINSFILEKNYISNLNVINKTSIIDDIEFHFWFNKENFSSFNLVKKFVNPLLFSNKLKFKDGLNENCTVIYHLEKSGFISNKSY